MVLKPTSRCIKSMNVWKRPRRSGLHLEMCLVGPKLYHIKTLRSIKNIRNRNKHRKWYLFTSAEHIWGGDICVYLGPILTVAVTLASLFHEPSLFKSIREVLPQNSKVRPLKFLCDLSEGRNTAGTWRAVIALWIYSSSNGDGLWPKDSLK